MAEFYVAFGQRFYREEHPVLPGVTPDHYVVITASSMEAAYSKAHEVFGDDWSALYSEEWFVPEFFPRGEFTRICGG